MWLRLAALALVLLAVVLLAATVVLDAGRSPIPSPTPDRHRRRHRSPRETAVAFWEARVADGGGLQSSLNLADALIERSRATGDLADLERAASVLDAVDAPDTDAGLVLRRGRVAFALHDFPAAAAAAEATLELAPSDPAALALLGDASLEMGDLATADAAYAALAEAGPARSPAILSRLARRAWLDGRVDAAEALVHDAIAGAQLAGTDDERAFYHFQLAEMLRGRNALADAEAAYRAALELQPDHVPSMGGLARVLEAQGRRDEAIPLLEAATARLPAPDLVAALGDLYALDGRADDAEDQWALVERIAEVGQASGGVHDRQLVLFLADHDRDPDRAVELARAELATRGDVYGHDALAWALFKAGDLEAAAARGRARPGPRHARGRGSTFTPGSSPKPGDACPRRGASPRRRGPERIAAPAPGPGPRGRARAARAMIGRLTAAAVLLVLLAALPAAASAHPLGNFTVNRALRVEIGSGVSLTAILDLAEIPAYEVIRDLDTDGDDAVSAAEGEPYAAATCEALGRPDHRDRRRRSRRRSNQPRRACPSRPVPAAFRRCAWSARSRSRPMVAGPHELRIRDATVDERAGWREVSAAAVGSATIEASDVPETSPSALLTAYPEAALASPPDVRAATLTFTLAAAPGRPRPRRPAASPAAAATSTRSPGSSVARCRPGSWRWPSS